MRIRLFAAVLTALLMAGCAAPGGSTAEAPAAPKAPAVDADRLLEWLTGLFETESQRGKSQRFMLGLPMPTLEPGRWIYVVQWKPGSPTPERQFVYHLKSGSERGLALDIYALLRPIENPMTPSAESLEAIRQSSLERREGCRIQLSQDGLSFVGGTRGRDCPTEYRHADRLRIELVVREGEVREWLQGYDVDGNRLWSAEDGGRVFRRIDPD